MDKITDYEKVMYKFAYECALKGIDIEETLGVVRNVTKEIFEIVINLTNKNYEYLKKCRDEGSKISNNILNEYSDKFSVRTDGSISCKEKKD